MDTENRVVDEEPPGGQPSGGKPPVQDLLTIGAFAARTRLPAKALRLYDRLGTS